MEDVMIATKKSAFKLFRLKASGAITSLFIDKGREYPLNQWMEAACHPTDGFKTRKGWHCLEKPNAPHLSKKDRVWARVEIKDFLPLVRPQRQGGKWYLSNWIRIKKVMYAN